MLTLYMWNKISDTPLKHSVHGEEDKKLTTAYTIPIYYTIVNSLCGDHITQSTRHNKADNSNHKTQPGC